MQDVEHRMENDHFWNEKQEQLNKKQENVLEKSILDSVNETRGKTPQQQDGNGNETELKSDDLKTDEAKNNNESEKTEGEEKENEKSSFAKWFNNALGKFILLGTFLIKQVKTLKFWRNLFIFMLSRIYVLYIHNLAKYVWMEC